MLRVLKFVFVGLFFAAFPGELWLHVFYDKPTPVFVATFIIYAAVLCATYFINRKFERRLAPSISYYFIFGFFGLVIEWMLLGNARRDLIAQIFMFSFWLAFFVMPRIFMDDAPEFSGLKKYVFRIYVPISVFITALVFATASDKGFTFILGVAGFILYAAMNVFYVQYFRIIHKFGKTNKT